jgi:molybdenum cofactor cytidylyltransferase
MAEARVVAIVLAAGRSRRMGQAKLLLPWGERTVLGQTLANLRAAPVGDVLVVTGHRAAAIAAVTRDHGGRVVFNPDWASGGRLSSLQAGLRALPRHTGAVLVALADQPMVGPEVHRALIAAWRAGGPAIFAPTHRGRRGNPVLFDRTHVAALLALPAGARPRDLLERRPEAVRLVEVGNEAVLADLDRPEDYRRWTGREARPDAS